MREKLILILVFFGILCIGTIQAQWNIEKCPTKNDLNSIFFTSYNSGWIVGDKGTILYKLGNGWKEYQKPTSNNLHGIFMLSDKDGWAVGERGTIIHYNGKNWQKVNASTEYNLYSVSFSDPENGIAVGENGVVIIYENSTWRLVDSKIRGNLYATTISTDETWIGGGLECMNVPILKIQNNRQKTMTSSFKTNATIMDLETINPNNAWAVGRPSTILHYDGQEWKKPDLSFQFPSLRSIHFTDENNGISVGYSGTVLVYYMKNWTKESTPTIQTLNGTAIVENYYYAVGDNGTIISRNNNTNNELKGIPLSDNIEIFPNPCNELLNIAVLKDEDCPIFYVTLTNNAGQICMQKEYTMSSENLSYTINTKDFKSGLYVFKANLGDKSITKKIIIKH